MRFENEWFCEFFSNACNHFFPGNGFIFYTCQEYRRRRCVYMVSVQGLSRWMLKVMLWLYILLRKMFTLAWQWWKQRTAGHSTDLSVSWIATKTPTHLQGPALDRERAHVCDAFVVEGFVVNFNGKDLLILYSYMFAEVDATYSICHCQLHKSTVQCINVLWISKADKSATFSTIYYYIEYNATV